MWKLKYLEGQYNQLEGEGPQAIVVGCRNDSNSFGNEVYIARYHQNKVTSSSIPFVGHHGKLDVRWGPVMHWQGENCGLHGQTGFSEKSIKNFVFQDLDEENAQNPHVALTIIEYR